MPNDPHHQRRKGFHRLRMATAALGMSAVLGTGALTWTISAQDEATATTVSATTESTTTESTTTESTTAGSTDDDAALVWDDGDSDAEVDASSGGS